MRYLFFLTLLCLTVCAFSQSEDNLKNTNIVKTNSEYLSVPLGVTFVTKHTGLQYFSGIEYHVNHFSLDGLIGCYPKNTYVHYNKFILGLGLSLYQRDSHGFYVTGSLIPDGVFNHFTDRFSMFDNSLTLLGGYRISGKYLSLKLGAGYYWSSYINGMVYEVKMGFRIINTHLFL